MTFQPLREMVREWRKVKPWKEALSDFARGNRTEADEAQSKECEGRIACADELDAFCDAAEAMIADEASAIDEDWVCAALIGEKKP